MSSVVVSKADSLSSTLNIAYCIWHNRCIMHNTSSTRKASNGRITHNTIERHNREIIVNFEQKYNNKLHLSSFLRKWHIFISTRIWCLSKNCWKIRWDDSLKKILIKLSSRSKVLPYLGKLAVNSDNFCICHIFLNVNRMYEGRLDVVM